MADETGVGLQEPPSGLDQEVESQVEETAGDVQEEQQPLSREEQGQLAALEAERERRQRAEQEADFYKNLALESQKNAYKQPEQEAYNPDDLADYKNVNHLVDKKFEQVQSQLRQQEIRHQEEAAKRKYTDFDQMIAFAADLSKKNPGLAKAIMAADDVADAAYWIGKSHPSNAQNLNKVATQQITKKISENLNRPATLTNAAGASVKQAADHWQNASSEDLEKRIHDIKFGRR